MSRNAPECPPEALQRSNGNQNVLRPCGHCGTPFEPHRGDHVFCSPSCRFKNWNDDHPRIDKTAPPTRPRSSRPHRGAEFQLTDSHLAALDGYATSRGTRDRSAALRQLIEEVLLCP